MSQNKGKGGKKKRRGKGNASFIVRELIKKDSDDQEYAQVIKLLGNARLEAKCFKKKDGEFSSKTRICLIRGKMRKRVWIATNDLILVSLREFDDDKGDVIHKYEEYEIKKLIKFGELPNIIFNSHVSNETEKKSNQLISIKEDVISFQNQYESEDDDIENI